MTRTSFESPIEAEMGKLLDEMKIPYQSQVEVGAQKFGGRCRSHYGCDYAEDNLDTPDYDDYEEGIIHREDPHCLVDGLPNSGECRWYSQIVTYPLYRLDFAVFIGEHKIAIECDGFDYHKRLSQQVENDIIRDRWLREHGWIVKRYGGTFITRHRNKVKQDIRELVDRLTPKDEPEQASLF